jgi:hypothetical protein
VISKKNELKDIEEHPKTTYDRPFRTLFEDGVQLCIVSERSLDPEVSNSLARGSIACTMMLPEVAANICIESLQLDASIFSEADKLSPLGKFDYFLARNYRGRRLSSGTLPVQGLQELKRLRDAFVHPKRYQVHWSLHEDDTYIGESRRTQFLEMSSNPAMWCVDDAIHAMRGVHGFLSHFFTAVCRMPRRKVNDLLFCEQLQLGSGSGSTFYYARDFHAALKRWQVDTSYFRIGVL